MVARGVCMVAPGGCMVFARGVCMVFARGACVVFAGEACMVFARGCVVFARGCMVFAQEGMHGFCWGVCVVFAMCRIQRDTVNMWAVRILLECILVFHHILPTHARICGSLLNRSRSFQSKTEY